MVAETEMFVLNVISDLKQEAWARYARGRPGEPKQAQTTRAVEKCQRVALVFSFMSKNLPSPL